MDLLMTNLCVSSGCLEPFSKTNPTASFSGSAALTLDSPSTWILELLPALGKPGAFISLKMGFLWVFMGFSQDFLNVFSGFSPGFLHITMNFPTTISCSKFRPMAPQINWDYLIGFHALLRGETLISQVNPWTLQTQSWSKECFNLFPLVAIKSPQPPGVGRKEESSRALRGREVEFPKQEHRGFLSRVKAPGMGLVWLCNAQNALENPTGSVWGEP